MFNRFSGVSHEEYALRQTRNGKASMVGQVSHPTAQAPGVNPWVKPGTKSLGQTTTKPLCLCKLQRDADAQRAARKGK
jgi:hypothetical protein